MPSSTQRQLLSAQDIQAACVALANCFPASFKYAVLGGATCQLLGPDRMTQDVDIVGPKDNAKAARIYIAADQNHFTIDKRTLNTHYKSSPPVEIEILAPLGTFKEPFDAATRTFTVEFGSIAIQVLHPVLILNAKCQSQKAIRRSRYQVPS